MTTFTTHDLGIAIRDHLETYTIGHYDDQGMLSGEPTEVEFVDVSDANNPIVHLDNGQKFRLVILTGPYS